MDALCADDRARTGGLQLDALRPLLGSDKSNRRRVIKTLVQRGDVDIVDDPETGERRLKLTFMACLQAMWKLSPPSYGKRGDTDRAIREERREREAALDEMLSLEADRRQARILRDRAVWAEPGTALKRHRSFGHRQLRVIAVLVRYARESREGLPRAAVRQIAAQGSGETQRSYERVIERLVERGILQQSRDGARVRLTDWRTVYLWKYLPNTTSPPLDDSKAKAVLEGSGEDWEPERKQGFEGDNQREAFKRPPRRGARMSEPYDPANKFGHPEDEPAVYYDDSGNRVSKEEWLQKIGVELPPERATESGSRVEYDAQDKFGYPEEWGQVEFKDENGNPLTPRQFMESIGLDLPDDLGTGPPDAKHV